MKPKRLIIIAPNDRYNYGDLLFSHIIKKELADLYDEVVNVATIENDLTAVGGDVVKSIPFVYNLSDKFENHLIIAGGESFFSPWYYALSYLDYGFNKKSKFIVKVLKKINLQSVYLNFSVLYAKYSINATTKYPYTIGKHEIKNADRVFYNSLGASWIPESFFKSKKVKEILDNVDYLSLRDVNSNDIVVKAGFKSHLVPDCAVVMSEYYTDSFLKSKISNDTAKFVRESGKKYFVFQINKALGGKNFRSAINMLKAVSSAHKLAVCLCPVGFALGHDDHEILEEVYHELRKAEVDVYFSSKLTIWDIMYLIAGARLFIGTSLHGVITSMSYKTPYIGILVEKTIRYINTWGINDDHTISRDFDLLEKVETLLNNSLVSLDNYELSYVKQKNEVYSSFSRMKELI